MSRRLAECGTSAANKRHLRRGEEPCRACKDAAAAAQRERRANPDVRADERLRNQARARALWRLAAENRERFRELFIEEVTK